MASWGSRLHHILMLILTRYHIPNRLKLKEQTEVAAKMGYNNITQLCFDRRLYIKEISKAEKNKHELFLQQSTCSDSSLPPMGKYPLSPLLYFTQLSPQEFWITSPLTT